MLSKTIPKELYNNTTGTPLYAFTMNDSQCDPWACQKIKNHTKHIYYLVTTSLHKEVIGK
jgi:hypothetical protein